MNLAPVALFVYNRPAHTRATVEALKRCALASETDLHVFSDAARSSSTDAAVRQVRAFARTIRGFRSVSILERQENFGLARSVIAGITELLERYGRVIVLEDDLVSSPGFLEYMNVALDRYEGNDRVMQVAGYMFPVELPLEDDALFLPFISSWGWATWRRAWSDFDRSEFRLRKILADEKLRRRFDLNGRYAYSRILRAQLRHRVDSWAIYWYASVFLRQGLALFPRKTLVKNIGFDGTGVNCTVSEFEQHELDKEFRVRRLPREIDISPAAETVIKGFPATRLSGTAILRRLSELFARSS